MGPDYLGLFRKGKTNILAKFHRTGLVIRTFQSIYYTTYYNIVLVITQPRLVSQIIILL